MSKRKMPRDGGSKGIACPSCQHGISHVYDTRGFDTCIRRFRRCVDCGHSFSTIETISTKSLDIVSGD